MNYIGETKLYEITDQGAVYKMPKNHCVFCKNCTDLLYDSSGPYCFFCNLGLEIEITETECKCDKFEDSGYIFDEEDYRKRMEATRLFMNEIQNTDVFKKEIKSLMNKILYGDSPEIPDELKDALPIWYTKLTEEDDA